MLQDNKSLNEFLNIPGNPNADLMLYCLSDRVSPSIDWVLTDEGNPIDYADRVMTTHFEDLYIKFFMSKVSALKLSKAFTTCWMYDTLAMLGASLRMMVIDPNEIKHTYPFLTKAATFLLETNDRKIEETVFSGLSFYPEIATNFITIHKEFFLSESRHAIFGVDKTTMFSLMEHFVELRSHSKVQSGDITEFITRLRWYCSNSPQNMLFGGFWEGSFAFFSQCHTSYQSQLAANNQVRSTKVKINGK